MERGQIAEGAFCDADDEDDKAMEAGEEKDPEDANGFAHSILIVKFLFGFGPVALRLAGVG